MALISSIPQGGTAVKGAKKQATVSATAQVYKGEFIQRVLEYEAMGDRLRWGLEDIHILAAEELSNDRVGIVFAQGGATKFKVVALEAGALALGNTLTIIETEALEAAELVELQVDKAIVLYNQEAAGMGTVISLDGRAAAVEFTDIWDDSDPENICGCAVADNAVLVAAMRQTQGNQGEIWARVVTLQGNRLYANPEVRVDVNNDTDVYVGAWSLVKVGTETAVLAFPQALDKPIGFVVLDVSSGYPPVPRVRLALEGKYAASMPTIKAIPLGNGRWGMFYGVGWLSADRAVVKSTLAMEIWGLTRYAAELLWYGCEDTRYAESIGGVSAAYTGTGAAVTYTGEGEARLMAMGLLEGPYPGPAISLGGHSGYCKAVAINGAQALVVSQAEGNGWVQAYQLTERVLPSETCIHGVALTGGRAGEKIFVQAPGERK